MAQMKGLESDRDAYFTPANVSIHLDIVEKVLLDMGYAIPNPSFDPLCDPLEAIESQGGTVPRCCERIILTEVGERCLISFDETDASLDSTQKSAKQATLVSKGS